MNYLKKIIKGIFIGVANIIPGVSGGTMAVSMGIYDDIIYSITHLKSEFKKSIKTLFPYIIGMGVGLAVLSFVIKYLLENYTFETNMAFIGLILGGIPVMLGRLKGKKLGISNMIIFLVFFGLVIGMQLLGEGDGSSVVIKMSALEVVKLLLIGVIASATMVVPGVSGSMMLLLIGYYYPILDAVTGIMKAVKNLDIPTVIDYSYILIPFGIGVVVGIFVIAKIIELLLKHYEGQTFSGILGLVIASPFAILMNSGLPEFDVPKVLISIVTFVIGLMVAYKLGEE